MRSSISSRVLWELVCSVSLLVRRILLLLERCQYICLISDTSSDTFRNVVGSSRPRFDSPRYCRIWKCPQRSYPGHNPHHLDRWYFRVHLHAHRPRVQNDGCHVLRRRLGQDARDQDFLDHCLFVCLGLLRRESFVFDDPCRFDS